ncbi:glutathione S-transferase [Acidithiobacillus thiooxidans]|uniref:glutathione S-transferase n=1 Tax=Acidithiobacillus thiooxidans TaxID=930 RepID=UPI001C06DB06|nr:glutathione S-transferase [Acidithiobacillus thiooxidans]MBU2752107.1 glutathione S-transferase [Acidithiobacillus thiooxidans]
MLTLIHFDFCPFCQRVRLALGYKGIDFNEQPARFYGPEHFQSISGFDRLPVVEYPDGSRQGESLEIIAELDRRFPETPPLWRGAIGDTEWERVQAWRARISGLLFRLIAPTLPQYASLGQDPRAMTYYRDRMESWLGDTLEGLQERRKEWYAGMEADLQEVTERVAHHGFYTPVFSVADTLITGDLTGLRLLEDIQLPPELTTYFERVEAAAQTTLLPTEG